MGTPTLPHVFLLSFLLLHCLLYCSDAEIKTGSITSDSGVMAFVARFAFDPHGRIAISLSDVAVTPSSSPRLITPDYSKIGFFLLSEDHIYHSFRKRLRLSPLSAYDFDNGREETHNASEIQAYLASRGFCALDSTLVRRLFTFRELPPPRYTAYNGTFDIPEADQYMLFFTSCAPGWRASMALRAELYTVRDDGSRDYLSAAFSFFPAVYTAFAGAYVALLLGVWLYVCFWRGELHYLRHHRQFLFDSSTTHRVHHLMAGLLLAKAIKLVCAAEDLRHVAAIGTPHSWDTPFYLLRLAKGALLLSAVFLAWSGWPFLKPTLQQREKRILSAVLPLQVLANAAFGAAGAGDAVTPFVGGDMPSWVGRAVLVVDAVCGLAVMYAVARSVRALREASSRGDGKAARGLARVVVFRRLYVVAVGHLYLAWVVVLAFDWLAPYEKRWVGAAAEEAASLAFLAYVCYALRPAEKDTYTSLSD